MRSFRLRHDAIGVQPTLDLAEEIGYDELPTALFAPNAVSALRAVAAEIDSLHKDVYSPAREEASSDTHNLLLILRRDHGSDRATAFAWRSACCTRASSRMRDPRPTTT
ncbi:hypothetical protein ACFWB2_28475 [Streptomyces virginiae]|uniref:terpene synthase family protein n=1 Tax=Streptomyces virginiae TaxID=1961 RepID=UPI003673A4ED